MSEPRELTDQEKVSIRDATYQLRVVPCCGFCRHADYADGDEVFVCKLSCPCRNVSEWGWCAMWDEEPDSE